MTGFELWICAVEAHELHQYHYPLYLTVPVDFISQAKTEPEQCIQRLICNLATGQMPESDNDIIPTLFRDGTDQTSSKFNYFLAAQLGKSTRDIKKCEITFSCSVPLDQVLE